MILAYWPCTYYRKGPISESSYFFQNLALLVLIVNILLDISIDLSYGENFI